MIFWSGAGSASQNELIGHELAIVFLDGAIIWPKAGMRQIRTVRPLPDIAEHVLHRRRMLPLHFGGQTQMGTLDPAAPQSVGGGLEVAHVGDGLVGIKLLFSFQDTITCAT